MKKELLIIVTLFITVIAIVSYKVYNYNQTMYKVKQDNSVFESLYQKEILGTDFATFLNRIDDVNNKNKVEKDNLGNYIENDTNSIKIDVKFQELEDVIPFERIEKQGISKLVQNFGTFKFKCTGIKYHEKTNSIKYMYFEQVE